MKKTTADEMTKKIMADLNRKTAKLVADMNARKGNPEPPGRKFLPSYRAANLALAPFIFGLALVAAIWNATGVLKTRNHSIPVAEYRVETPMEEAASITNAKDRILAMVKAAQDEAKSKPTRKNIRKLKQLRKTALKITGERN